MTFASRNLVSLVCKALVLTAVCFINSAPAQSWVTGSPPDDSVATTYFPYLATQLTTATKYGTHNSSEVGDIWVPNYNGKTPPANANSRPAVLIVHGGGGTSGTRSSNREIQMSQFCAAHGYVAFNIDYSLGVVWPKDVYDWRLAIRFLRANAATYGIDPNHIGVIGGSFGGFCAGNLSGITNGQRTIYSDSNAAYNNISLDGYSGEALNVYSGDVQVACDLYGPMDQTTSGNAGGIYSSPTTATLKNSSAVQYVHPTSAPLLISHGTADTTVSITQSEEMTNKLGQTGVPFQFKIWSGVGHTFLIYQTGVDLRKQWMDWFDKYLLVSSVAPYIQVQPANQSGCLNNSATFTVTANGTTPLAYQWYGPTGAIAGATSATYSDPSLAAGDAGSYSVVITNAFGAVTSSVVTLTVNNLNPPAISTDVADVAVLAGNPATLTITATGDNLQYQWYGPAGLIANATNASYVITNAAVTDAGTYQVLVYNPCATLPSRLATLTVNGPPAITANPAGATNCTGDTVSFVVSATGTAPLAYQWFGPGGSLSGPNATSLTLTNLSTANSGTYYCTVTNAYGSVSSANATLLVSSNADVTFTQQPTDVTVDSGNSASFTVTVSGGGNYSYLWLKNDYDTITNAVATNATLTLTNLSAADSGTYFHCLVNNDCSIFSSANAYVYVNGASVTVTTNFTSSGTWTCPAGVTTLTVQCWGGGGGGGGTTGTSNKRAGGGGAGGAYVKNTAVTAVPGTTYAVTVGAGGFGGGGTTATSNGGNGGNSSFSGSGITSVVATGGSGGYPGNSTNYAAGGPGGTGSTAANAGFTTGFSFAGGNGANGVTNQYSGGGGAAAGSFGVGGNAIGVTGGTNTMGSIGGAGGAGTSVSGSGQSGSVPGGGGGGGLGGGTNSASGAAGQVTLSYNVLSGGQAPTIVGQPQGVTNASGNSILLQVTASGSPSPTYQWRKEGSPVSGQTAAVYTINSAATTDSGSYEVVVANSSGSVTSSIAVLLITNAAPSITVPPQNQTISAGGIATFSLTASGSLPLAYQWLRNSSPISGATNSNYSFSGVATGDSGSTFSVTVTNAYGAVTSAAATLTVNPVVAVGTVVIAEVYAGGGKTSATYKNDYVVLKNLSAASVNLSGWSLQHDKVGVWQAPYAFTNANATIPPGGYYLIQCYNDGGTASGGILPTPDEVAPQSGIWNMSYASADAVALVNSTVNVSNFLSGTAGVIYSASAAAAGIVDLVGSGTSAGNDYFGTGIASGGSATNAVIRKNSGCQNTPDNSLDFATGTPSPKNSLTTPSPCNPVITQQPANQSVLAGQNASFVVVATGGGLGYQWRFANAPLANAVAASLVLTNVAAPNAGNYAVVITNAYGAVTSSVAGLTVTLPPALSIVPAVPGSGVVGLSGVTIPGLIYVVQSAASLVPANWVNLLTNNVAPNGSFSFQTNAAAAGNQYFRILFP
jgi:acetyl esterase/lipase